MTPRPDSELTEVMVGRQGLTYVRRYLTERGDTVSMAALDVLTSGEALVYLPADFENAALLRFEEGGIMRNPDLCDAVKTRVSEFVARFLVANSEGIAMCETCYGGSESQSASQHANVPYFLYAPTRYGTWDGRSSRAHETGLALYLRRSGLKSANIDHCVCGAGRPDTLFLSLAPAGFDEVLEQRKPLSRADVDDIFRGLVHVIVPVYDGESYLIWSGSSGSA